MQNHSPSVCVIALALSAAPTTAQVSVRVVTAQQVSLQAQVAGASPSTVAVPVGIDITNVGMISVSSSANGFGGYTGLVVTPSTSPYGPTCEIRAEAGYYTGSGAVLFSSQESGAELIEFSSLTPIAGVLVAEAQFVPSAGIGFGTGTIRCDFGNDGSVELTENSPLWRRHSQPCTLGPGQPFVVRVQHQGSLAGTVIGDYSTRATVRFVPHADGLVTYGPGGCGPTLVSQFLTGGSLLMLGYWTSAPDFFVVLLGQTQVLAPLPIPANCPQLSSGELLLGPYAQGNFVLPGPVLPVGTTVFVQVVGLYVSSWTATASLGIRAFGQ